MRRLRPQRTCIVCRLKTDKDELLRIVRLPDHSFKLDRSGCLPGRGAYVCRFGKCWEFAIDGERIRRAFGASLGDTVLDRLRSQLRGVVLHEDPIQ